MKTPVRLVIAALVMLPRLEASESLLAAVRGQMGSGWVKPELARSIAAGWARQADPAPRRPSTLGNFASVGFGVRLVTVKVPTPEGAGA